MLLLFNFSFPVHLIGAWCPNSDGFYAIFTSTFDILINKAISSFNDKFSFYDYNTNFNVAIKIKVQLIMAI